MGIILETIIRASLCSYAPEYNPDGTEKHVRLDGARFHVVSWDSFGSRCSVPNCEINRNRKESARC